MNTELNTINGDFPFEIIKRENEDYFSSVEEAQQAGFNLNQIWAVVNEDYSFAYGPSHLKINLLGYIATNETHDGNTLYVEDDSDEFDEDDE